jgi:magnesium-transporting ATPase (P-type)
LPCCANCFRNRSILREGKVARLVADQLVPGDIVLLEQRK